LSCQNTNQGGQKTISDSSQLIKKDSLLRDTSTNQVSVLNNNGDKKKITCDSLLNLFGRSSSYDSLMKFTFSTLYFKTGI
jgi:hypothetical protein